MPSARKKIVIKIKIRHIAYSLLITILLILIYFYDQQVLYYTAIPLRYIFDISLFTFIFVPAYAVLKYILSPKREERIETIRLTEEAIKAIPLINALFLLNTLRLSVPAIGYLETNMITQGLEALPFYALYLLACLANGLMLFIALTGSTRVNVYDIFVYSVAFMALQTIASIYGFHIAGLGGLRAALACLSVGLPTIYIYRIRKENVQSIILESDKELPLVLILSIATFFFYYFRALYTHFSDQAVMLANVNSILYRGDLEPYYKACEYYPAVGGFYIASFIYTTGLDNTILASTLSFTIAHTLLPIVVYRLMRLLVDNGFVALLTTVMVIHMDGLGILAYPIYKPIIDHYLRYASNITYNSRALYILNFKLSPQTCSLYSSNICHFWFNPYKVFAMLASATSVTMFSYPRLTARELILAGLLLSVSLTHPKATPLILLSFTLLWGLKRINTLKDILVPIFTGIIGLGPLAWAILYKLIGGFVCCYLPWLYDLSAEERVQVMLIAKHFFKTCFTHPLTFAILLVLVVLTIYHKMRASTPGGPFPTTDALSPKISASRLTSLLMILFIVILAFIASYIHGLLPCSLSRLIAELRPLSLLRYLVMRYHVMIAFLIMVPALFRMSPRLLLSLVLMLCSIYVLGSSAMYLPIPLLILGVPILHYLTKQKSNSLIAIPLLISLALGVLTNGLYGIPIASIKADPIYEDMPHVINILLECSPDTKIHAGSHYNYFIGRTLGFAQLRASNSLNSSGLCLIDKQYGIRINLKGDAAHILYSGERLMLVKLEG